VESVRLGYQGAEEVSVSTLPFFCLQIDFNLAVLS
jgi:hypothetical protein